MKKKLFILLAGVAVTTLAVVVIFSFFRSDEPKPPTRQTDTEAPTLALDDEVSGQIFGCTLRIMPDVRDNVAVQRVEYYIDGSMLHVTYAAPFNLNVAFKDRVEGERTVKLAAYDTSGNKTETTVTIVVQRPQEGCPGDEDEEETEEQTTPGVSPGTQRPPAVASGPSAPGTGDPAPGGGNGDNGGGTPPPPPPPDTEPPTAPASLVVSFDGDATLNALNWDASTDNVGVTGYRIERDGNVLGTSTNTHYFDMQIEQGYEYEYQVFAFDAADNISDGSNEVGIQLESYNFWEDTIPTTNQGDSTALELGMKFQARVPGEATGVRFYKGAGNTGTHTGTLWLYDTEGNSGTSLATVTFADETASGWQTAYFDEPVELNTVDVYVVSYFAPEGNTSWTDGFFSTTRFDDYLIAHESAGDWVTGSYRVGSTGFPDQTAGVGTVGYAVDIAFRVDEPPEQEPLTNWSNYYNQWSNGPEIASNSYPTAIWMQWAGRTFEGVANGINYQNLGIHFNNGLHNWLSGQPEQITDVIATDWRAFAHPGTDMEGIDYANTEPGGAYLKGWLLEDEPDMNKVNCDPAPCEDLTAQGIAAFGNAVRAADPTRPTVINFGKGLAVDLWPGYTHIDTGSRYTDFVEYCSAGDIVSADYYGWTDPAEPASYMGAWTYGKMIDLMRTWCGDDKPVWGFVELARIWTSGDCGDRIPTPDEVEQAVWNMVIHGANGMNYFTQQFCGGFIEDAFLYDEPMRQKIGEINSTLQSFAQQLNTTTSRYVAAGKTDTPGVPLSTLTKQTSGQTYVFAQASGSRTEPNSAATTGRIAVNTSATTATVIGEGRTVPIVNGWIVDGFDPYGVHVYRF